MLLLKSKKHYLQNYGCKRFFISISFVYTTLPISKKRYLKCYYSIGRLAHTFCVSLLILRTQYLGPLSDMSSLCYSVILVNAIHKATNLTVGLSLKYFFHLINSFVFDCLVQLNFMLQNPLWINHN